MLYMFILLVYEHQLVKEKGELQVRVFFFLILGFKIQLSVVQSKFKGKLKLYCWDNKNIKH